MKDGSHSPTEDAEIPTISSFLLSEVRQMSPEGWTRLVSVFGPVVYRWCRCAGISNEEAADVVQEVFATIARRIADFERMKEQGSFRSWIATITRSRVTDYFRRRAKQGVAIGGTDALLRLQEKPELLESTIDGGNIQNQLLHSVTESVKNEFEATTWAAFMLTTVQEKQAAEVARDLGISVASVYQAKSRVLRRLRQRMAELPQ